MTKATLLVHSSRANLSLRSLMKKTRFVCPDRQFGAETAEVAMIMFSVKGRPPGEMAAMIGNENRDANGALGIRDSSGN
jgi:hypothetical protein